MIAVTNDYFGGHAIAEYRVQGLIADCFEPEVRAGTLQVCDEDAVECGGEWCKELRLLWRCMKKDDSFRSDRIGTGAGRVGDRTMFPGRREAEDDRGDNPATRHG
jgi:hypothetical protein